MKDLPEMYHHISKDFHNNEKVYSSIYNKKESIIDKVKNKIIDNKKEYTIEQKIYNIFNSPNYIYKMDVVIVTDEGKVNKRIVGKTRTNLITMDGEYIPINKIRDIYVTR